MGDQLKWWGYLHTNGSIQAKRYFEPLDINEAMESDFVSGVHGPFSANDRDDALRQLNKYFNGPNCDTCVYDENNSWRCRDCIHSRKEPDKWPRNNENWRIRPSMKDKNNEN